MVLSIASALVLLLSSVYDLDKETGVVRRFFSEAAGIGDGEDFIRENYSDASTLTCAGSIRHSICFLPHWLLSVLK